jgi:hypothetical protein
VAFHDDQTLPALGKGCGQEIIGLPADIWGLPGPNREACTPSVTSTGRVGDRAAAGRLAPAHLEELLASPRLPCPHVLDELEAEIRSNDTIRRSFILTTYRDRPATELFIAALVRFLPLVVNGVPAGPWDGD